ncbi:ThiF family adenylyltransferase [Streptosporangiaceae bacterium NEAU-GS5]|nr:ThiF family adenylyltransferase [Streptosporangiaceae bacterium NEAU-GS5]
MTNIEVVFYDSVLRDIDEHVAAYQPERGGALMGPIGQPVVSLFLPDPHAAATHVTYTTSDRLRKRVSEVEGADQGLELKGIVHSHPGGMNVPSGGDHVAFADSLRRAPWLGRFICPIVTVHSGVGEPGRHGRGQGSRPAWPGDTHRLPLPHGTMSVYVAEARTDDAVKVVAAYPRVLPLAGATQTIAGKLRMTTIAIGGQTTVDGATYTVSTLSDDAIDATILYPMTYPTLPPVILLTPKDAGRTGRTLAAALAERFAAGTSSRTIAVPLAWDLNAPEADRLAVALDQVVASGRRAGGPGGDFSPGGGKAAVDPAALRMTRRDAVMARDGIRARLDGAAAMVLREARVLIVGLGSGGSQTAEALARASVEHFTLIDPDQVGPENLSRSVYVLDDVGKNKTDALSARLRAINPAVTIQTVPAALSDVSSEALIAMVEEADLVIAATDDPKAQLTLNHHAWLLGRPAVFGGMYAKGRAGEVVFTVPGLTRCYRCAASTRGSVGGSDDAGMNYGTGKLNAEPALGVDISHVVTASVKIAIGLMELSHPSAHDNSGANLVKQALGRGHQFLILSTVPEWDFFPKVFAETPGQLGYQSVWMTVTGEDTCATCGTDPMGIGESVTGSPDVFALKALDEEPGD